MIRRLLVGLLLAAASGCGSTVHTTGDDASSPLGTVEVSWVDGHYDVRVAGVDGHESTELVPTRPLAASDTMAVTAGLALVHGNVAATAALAADAEAVEQHELTISRAEDGYVVRVGLDHPREPDQVQDVTLDASGMLVSMRRGFQEWADVGDG